MRRRNRAFDTGRREVHDVGVPVISVGNLTLGGTGKTPMVLWLARWFRDRGLRVALVSRGYKATADSANDEARELEQRLPEVSHLQNPDRVAAARLAVQGFDAQIILLDDGFQHRRIARNLDIVLLDALEPFGFGHVFPRGTLREPLDGLRRADVIVLTRADMVDEVERARIRGIVERFAPNVGWAECRHAPQALISASGMEQPLNSLRGRRVVAFCGIGNPAGFRHTLDECGCRVTAWREFPDHYAYQPSDIEALASWAQGSQAETIICTHKDLVKLAVDQLVGRTLLALTVGMEFLSGQEALESKLNEVLAKCRASPTKVTNDKARGTRDAAQLTGWSTIQVAGKPCEIFEPAVPSPHAFSLVYLHGVHSKGLADSAVFTDLFQKNGLRVIAPMTGPSWWTDRVYPEFDTKLTTQRHLLDNIVPWIGERWNSSPPRIALLGTSMGGQGALRLAFKFPNVFPIVAAIAPAIDYQLRYREGDETLRQMYTDEEQVRQDTATLHVHPLNWPRNIWFSCDPADHRWHESADRLRMKLAALGVPYQCDLETSGGGHGIEYYNHMAPAALAFIVDRLEHERLRLA